MATRILLIRHGEAKGTPRGVLLGRTDRPLSERGRVQSKRLRGILPRGSAVRFVSSPLARARQTAEMATQGCGIAIEIEPDLREVDFGRWEGLTFEQIKERDAAAVDRWSISDPGFTFPEGESLEHFYGRVVRVGDRLAAAEEEIVVAFAHGGVIRTLLCHFLGLEFRHFLLFELEHASVASLRLSEGRATLTAFGSVSPCDQETRAATPSGWHEMTRLLRSNGYAGKRSLRRGYTAGRGEGSEKGSM